MKKPSKKLIAALTTVLIVVFFVGIIGAMAVAGKIDLSGVPVVGTALDEAVTAFSSDNGEGTITQQQLAAVAEKVTPADQYTSVTDVAVSGDYIYAADKTGKKVYKLSDDGKVAATYSADDQVNGVCVDGNNVYALVGAADGRVVVLDTNLKASATIPVGHTPNAMIVKGTKAYVANRFDSDISVIDLSSKKETKVIETDGREAVDMALAGNKIYVASHLPDDASTEDVVSANITVIDTTTDKLSKTIELVNGAGGVKAITAAPDGKTVYVSHVVARYAYPTTQLDRGWINTNGFSIIDTATDTATAVLLDEVELGASNPWGVGVSADGKKLVVAISGTDEAIVVDIAKMNSKINAVKNGNGVVKSVDKIVDYLPFLDDCRTRVALSGKGARAVAIDGDTAYIGQYFTGDIEVVNLTNATASNITFINQPEQDQVRRGEMLFADATLCYQKWESCLSCHPDGLADGFNWDNLNDGMGTPKSARSMLYSHRTPPVMSTGIRADAETAVRAGMKYIQFNVLPEEDLVCIDEYLKSLQPEQSPYLNTDGTLTESAERGKELFESEGCATCHPAPLYVDFKMHDSDLSDGSASWEYRQMDTPTLVEVWRTGPWGYDGRFATMEDAVRFYARNSGLTDQEITDLANFVLSIGDEGEQYGVERAYTTANGTLSHNKLVAGGEVTSLTIRKQHEDAVDTAVITATLTDADGKTIKTATTNIKDLQFNTAKEIKLEGFKIPNSGAKLTVTIKDSQGKDIASPFVINQ